MVKEQVPQAAETLSGRPLSTALQTAAMTAGPTWLLAELARQRLRHALHILAHFSWEPGGSEEHHRDVRLDF